MSLFLAAALALAQDTAEPAGDVAEEVIVYGELLVVEARRRVDAELREAGFTLVKSRGDKTIYRHIQPYRGEVVVHEEDGFMRVKRQPVRIEGREMPWAERNSALAWAGCVLWLPLCVRPAGQLQNKRRHQGVETTAAQLAQDDVAHWAGRISDLAVERKASTLPDQLEALWEHGTPLEDDAPQLVGMAQRRRAIFDFWATRTDTTWGEEIREVVESFCRGVVQYSDHPFTADELASWNAESPAGRALELPGAE